MEAFPFILALSFAGGVIALVLFGFRALLRRLFYRLGGSVAAVKRLAAVFEQTFQVLIWIGFPLAFAWLGANALGYATAASYLAYLTGAVFASAAVVLGLTLLMLWLFVGEDSTPEDDAGSSASR